MSGGPPATAAPAFREALAFWVRLGFINFGGPAGQIAIMHRELAARRGWIGERAFLRALNFCMILPGPEAQQLATYIGWSLHGTAGGLAAGALFVLPSVAVLLLLSWLAAAHAGVPAIAGILYGVQPIVVAIVADAVIRIGRRATRHAVLLGFAAAAFAALRGFGVPFPAIIAAAALLGVGFSPLFPGVFAAPGGASSRPRTAYPPVSRAVRITALFAVLWAVPVGGLWLLRGGGDVLVREALFFTRAAFVTFGGAYAVLAYIADVAVQRFAWLTADQMVQGLGLAESTPGPLIMVTQFVGFLGAWNHAGPHDPLWNGVLGALVTTWVTFLPSFLFIFVGAPYIEALAASRRVQAALTGVTAAVVGVILNLAVFFGERVLWTPAGGLDRFALFLALLSFAALRLTRLSVPALVGAGAALGVARALFA
jgi:chromate transporter